MYSISPLFPLPVHVLLGVSQSYTAPCHCSFRCLNLFLCVLVYIHLVPSSWFPFKTQWYQNWYQLSNADQNNNISNFLRKHTFLTSSKQLLYFLISTNKLLTFSQWQWVSQRWLQWELLKIFMNSLQVLLLLQNYLRAPIWMNFGIRFGSQKFKTSKSLIPLQNLIQHQWQIIPSKR
jgi:hypothetical protein